MGSAAEAARVAIVTGGVRGLGRAITARMRADGFRVAVADLDSGAACRQGTRGRAAVVPVAYPDGPHGRPDELAEMVSWLASERCSFSTGATFDLSGGRAVYCRSAYALNSTPGRDRP